MRSENSERERAPRQQVAPRRRRRRVAARDEAARQTAESRREALKGFNFEGSSFVCSAAASSSMLFKATRLKGAFLSLLSPPSLPRNALIRRRPHGTSLIALAEGAFTSPTLAAEACGGAQWGVSTPTGPLFVCLHKTRLRRHLGGGVDREQEEVNSNSTKQCWQGLLWLR